MSDFGELYAHLYSAGLFAALVLCVGAVLAALSLCINRKVVGILAWMLFSAAFCCVAIAWGWPKP